MLQSLSRVRRFVLLTSLLWPLVASGEPGFTEPDRKIQLAAPELATVARVLVEPGQRVKAGQVLFELDSRALQATLAVADARRSAVAERQAAQARVDLHQQQFDRIESAYAQGHARAEELERTRGELRIAKAELQSVGERQRIAALEHERIAVEIQRRQIASPIDATVIEVLLEPGEALTPSSNVLASLAVLDPLRIRLNVAASKAKALTPGETLDGQCADRAVTARVYRTGAVIDAATGTVEVHLRLANPERSILSGSSCEFSL